MSLDQDVAYEALRFSFSYSSTTNCMKMWFIFSPFPSRYSSLFNCAQEFIHLEWLFIWHFPQHVLQPSKKGKRCIPQMLIRENQTQCDFQSSEADYNEGNPEWRRLCYFLLRSQWVISLQNNKEYLCLIEQSPTQSKEQGHEGWTVYKNVPSVNSPEICSSIYL